MKIIELSLIAGIFIPVSFAAADKTLESELSVCRTGDVIEPSSTITEPRVAVGGDGTAADSSKSIEAERADAVYQLFIGMLKETLDEIPSAKNKIPGSNAFIVSAYYGLRKRLESDISMVESVGLKECDLPYWFIGKVYLAGFYFAEYEDLNVKQGLIAAKKILEDIVVPHPVFSKYATYAELHEKLLVDFQEKLSLISAKLEEAELKERKKAIQAASNDMKRPVNIKALEVIRLNEEKKHAEALEQGMSILPTYIESGGSITLFGIFAAMILDAAFELKDIAAIKALYQVYDHLYQHDLKDFATPQSTQFTQGLKFIIMTYETCARRAKGF